MSHHRELRTILFLDLVGYSSIMNTDEESSIKLLNDFNTVVQKETSNFNGKIWNNYGDGFLVAFISTLDALGCAESLQKRFRSSYHKIEARIGLHLGEIIIAQDNIHGDAVNIASRIESAGIPNSILLSQMVFEQIKNKANFKTISLGSFNFKNIKDPIEVHALSNIGLDIPDREKLIGKFETEKKSKIPVYASIFFFAFALIFAFQIFKKDSSFGFAKKQQKSIAVFPINSIGGDEAYQNQCYAMSFAIHQNLSRLSHLSLLSFSDIFSSINGGAEIRNLAKSLSLNYYVTGNALFYNQEDRRTIQVELIESEENSSIWSNKYDYNLGNMFSMAIDDIALRIVSQLEIELTDREKELLSMVPTENSEAYNYYVQANRIAEVRTADELAKSVALLDKAIALDSSFALAYAEKASKVFAQGYYNFRNPSEAFEHAENLAQKAIAIQHEVFVANSVLATIAELVKKDNILAETLYKRAIEVNPNDATAYRHYSIFLKRNRRYEDAISLAKRSVTLSPLGLVNNLNYIDLLITNNKLDQALLQMDLFKTHHPDKEDQLWGYFGDIYARQGNIDKAIEYYELRLPTKASISGELGYCYGRKKQVDKALKLIENIPDTRYSKINKALIFNGLSHHFAAYHDSTAFLIAEALDEGIGANVVCDHPFFTNIKDKFCGNQ